MTADPPPTPPENTDGAVAMEGVTPVNDGVTDANPNPPVPTESNTEDALAAPIPTATPTSTTSSTAVTATAPPRILLHRDADEDADEDEDVDMPLSRPPQPTSTTSAADTVAPTGPTTETPPSAAAVTTGTGIPTPAILSRIITPSPFPQHTPQSRFRRALRRVALRPTRDAEAWEAVIAEASACYKSVLDEATTGRGGLGGGVGSAAVLAISTSDDPNIHARLDWVESCYGALVVHFPGAAHVHTALAELLMAQSTRPDDDGVGGVADPYGRQEMRMMMPWETTSVPTRRSLVCEAKLHHLLRTTLGVTDWATEVPTTTSSSSSASDAALCSWCVELWLVYVKTKAREVRREVGTSASANLPAASTALSTVRDATVQSYELAITHAGFGPNQHLLWRQYLDYVQSWTNHNTTAATAPGTALDHAVSQQQLVRLRSIYQRAVALPGIDLDALWAEYEAFEVSRSAALASALLAELRPKWQHAKTVYLERSRVCGGATTATLQQRLATEPVRATMARTTASAPGTDGATPSAAAGATVGGVEGEGGDAVDDEDDVAAKLEEEYRLLKLWKVRCAYERTNPERLPNPKELQHRVRTAFKEMVCALTRHPESWHMWSAWELQIPASSSTTPEGPAGGDATNLSSSSARARAVLQLAQTHIPDSTLLCYAEAQLVELHTDRPADCIDVMEQVLQRSPNTLAFALYQRMVRRYRGIPEARAVFARARRVLDPHPTTSTAAATAALTTGAPSKRSSVVAGRHLDGGADDDEDGDEAANEAAVAAAAAAASAELQGASSNGGRNPSKRWMVTNRLDENIPPVGPLSSGVARPDAPKSAAVVVAAAAATALAPPPTGLAPITWHLYASHATIEHRLNGVPEVAARVYELGLRKHAAFLTQPPYVMRYAQLLLELRDPVNLRSLLTRAIAACHDAASSSSESNPTFANSSRAALPVLWDVYLRFESVLSASDPMGAKRLHEIEVKRRQAVLGADVEDVATGGLLSTSDVALVGAQKAPISELLVRAEGYDASSSIVSGLSRQVDLLDTMGLWGSDAAALSLQRARYDPDVEVSGGASDASYHRRLKFQTLAFSGASTEAAALESGGLGGRGMSARERLQQGSGAGLAAGAPGQPTAMMLAIQQSPEWLRPLLLLLPASRLRLPIVSKPSPQVVELALNALRQNQLPAERPADAKLNGSGRKRPVSSGMGGGGDSSDEEDGAGTGQGYGNFFRSRQRARMTAHAGTSDTDAAS